MSFRYVRVIGWNPKKNTTWNNYPSSNTHEPHMEATTPKSEAAFFGDMGFFGKMRGTKKRPSFAWRHEGDLRFWDILGRWLYKVKVGFFFYIFLLPDEVKDWSLCANWPLTLMERIHLEKDNLPRFVFFRLRHTVLLKRAKFKVCIMEKPL